MNLPKLVKVKQFFPSRKLINLEDELMRVISSSNLNEIITPGMKVAITVGSRGINNIDRILKTITSYVKELGGIPSLFAAMGSHGGSCSAGQRKVLHALGISEKTIGVPVLCSTNCFPIGRAFYGNVYLIKEALDFDAIIVLNRVKPHTSFHGDYESGLLKMLVVGMGGPAGADSFHQCETALLSKAICEAAKIVLDTAPVVQGIAIIEDAYEQTSKITAIKPEHFYKKEKILLEEARTNMPRLPIINLDVLIVDNIGKNISGTGMDTNIIGRLRIHGTPEPDTPRIKRIVVLDIHPKSQGNAYGIGLADFTTAQLVNKIARESMYNNALTSTFVQRAMLPMVMPNDRGAVEASLKSLGATKPEDAKVIRIHNTLDLSEIMISEKSLDEAACLQRLNIVSPPLDIAFTKDGTIVPF